MVLFSEFVVVYYHLVVVFGTAEREKEKENQYSDLLLIQVLTEESERISGEYL